MFWRHYVYIHYKATNNEPFYVGKGSAHRGSSKVEYERAYVKDRGAHWKNVEKKYGRIVEIIASCPTDEEAQRLERQLIFEIGRLDLGTGSLINRTDGGDGCAGIIVSKEARKKLRDQMLNNPVTPEWRAKMVATRKKNGGNGGVIKKGDKLPESWRKNIAKKKVGILNPQFGKVSPQAKKVKNINTGVVYDSIARAAEGEGIADVFFLYSCLSGNRRNVFPHIVLVQNGM